MADQNKSNTNKEANPVEIVGEVVIFDQKGEQRNDIQVTETVEVFERDGRFRPEIPGASVLMEGSDGQMELENDPNDYVLIREEAEGAKERLASRGNGALVESLPREDEADYIDPGGEDNDDSELVNDDDFYFEEEDFSQDQFQQKEQAKRALLNKALDAISNNDHKALKEVFEEIADIRGLTTLAVLIEEVKTELSLSIQTAKHLVQGNTGGIEKLIKREKAKLRYWFCRQLVSKK